MTKTYELDTLFVRLLTGSLCKIFVKMDGGVKVPSHLYDSKIASFNLSWRFKAPMEIQRDGIVASLSFQGQEFDCWFPYDSIVGAMQESTGDRWIFGTEAAAGGGRRFAVPGRKGCAGAPGKEPDPNPPPKLRVVK